MTKTAGTKEWCSKNINFSKGCPNDCVYCYAKSNGNRFGWKLREDWHNIENKDWMAQVKFEKIGGCIMSPSSHDIVPQNVKLAITVFKNILEPGNTLLIVTKPRPRIIRKLCRELKQYKDQILFRFTITSYYNDVLKTFEPNAPRFKKRLKALKIAYRKGFQTSISIEPFLDPFPFVIIKRVQQYVTDSIWIGPLNYTHVPKGIIDEEQKFLYTSKSLKQIKEKIDSLGFDNIRYKDHFLNAIKGEDS